MMYVFIFFLIIGLLMFIHKLVYKSRMQRQLGRKVQDRELTSISSWMESSTTDKK